LFDYPKVKILFSSFFTHNIATTAFQRQVHQLLQHAGHLAHLEKLQLLSQTVKQLIS